MPMKEAYKLNLKQCLEIRNNGYRSKHCTHDYYPDSVERRIEEIQRKNEEKAYRKSLRAFNSASSIDPKLPPIPSDEEYKRDLELFECREFRQYVQNFMCEFKEFKGHLIPKNSIAELEATVTPF